MIIKQKQIDKHIIFILHYWYTHKHLSLSISSPPYTLHLFNKQQFLEKIVSIRFVKTEVDENGISIEDEEQETTLKANIVISAFGSSLYDQTVISALEPLKLNKYGNIDVDLKTSKTQIPWLFAGGDVVGIAETTVEAVNDGKTSAWSIHRYIQVSVFLLKKNCFFFDHPKKKKDLIYNTCSSTTIHLLLHPSYII